MEFSEVIKNRYSCKKYAATPLEAAKLQEILTAGRLAPTAKNQQKTKIYVAQTPESLAKIDSLTPCRYGAPVVLVVTCKPQESFIYPGGKYNTAVEDAAIVATHMLLAAYNAGIDSCWLNLFDPDLAAKTLNLPEGEEVVMFLDLGYKDPTAGPLPNHNSRKELAETVQYL